MTDTPDPDYGAQLLAQEKPDDLNMTPKPLKPEAMDQEEHLALARERAELGLQWWDDNHERSARDVAFSTGVNQWDDNVRAARGTEPCLTFNTMPQFIDQISGQMRQQRPAIHIAAADDHAGAIQFTHGKANRKVKGAEILEGIVRAIEFESNAEAHYDQAAEHAVDGGFGWLRVKTEYATRRSFDQRLRISSIQDRWSVVCDPTATEPDFSDMEWAFVFGSMSTTEFDRRYPDKRKGELQGLSEHGKRVWLTEGRTGVAEYMWREGKTRELILFSNGQIAWADEVKELLPFMAQQPEPVTPIRWRKVVDWAVYWELIGSHDVLEKRVRLPFRSIPLVPVLGKVKHLRTGETHFRSAIRDSIEPSQAFNYWMSAATSRVGRSAHSRWVGTASAIEGFEGEWARANDANGPAYLPYNDDAPAPPQFISPPPMPVAEIQMAMHMNDLKKQTAGLYDASIGAESAEKSGRAILARQSQSNNGSFAFTDNLNRAIRRVGLLLLDAIPVIYDTDRVVRMRAIDGADDWVRVNQIEQRPKMGEDGQPVVGPDGQPQVEEVVTNALGQGEFDVVVKAGPSFASQRMEAAEAQMELMTIAPNLIPIIGDEVIGNMDWPGADKISRRLRLMVDPKLLTAQEKEDMAEDPEVDPETGQPAEAAPDPAVAMQEAMMQKQMELQEAEHEAAMIEANAKKVAAEADMIEAETKRAQAILEAQALGLPFPAPDQQAPAAPPPMPQNAMPAGAAAMMNEGQ